MFLTLVVGNIFGQELIVNGNFSTPGSAWVIGGDFQYGQTYPSCPCGTSPCYGYAYLSTPTGGQGSNLAGDISQQITIPANSSSATLSFCYNGSGSETSSGNDILVVGAALVNSPYTLLQLGYVSIVGNVTGTTISYPITNPAFLSAGTQINVIFEGTTNATLNSTIRLDNVSFTYVSCTAPGTATVSGPNAACQGSSQTYNCSSSGATSYSWILPSGWSGSSTSSSINVTVGSSSGNVSCTPSNGCGSGTQGSQSVTVNPSPSGATVSGPNTVCQGSSQTYNCTSSGATSYSWTLPSGWSGSSTSSSISVTVGSISGNVSCTPSNSCSTGTQGSQSVTVNPSIGAATVSGPNAACQSSSQTFYCTSSGATTYSWTIPSGWLGSSTSSSISVTVGSSSGNVSCTPSNNCGTGTQGSQSVTVNPSPTTPSITAQGGITSFCQGTGSATLQVSNPCTGCNYTWYPAGSGISNPVTSGGTYYCTSSNSCGGPSAQSNSIVITVNTVPSVSFTQSGIECIYNFTDNSTGTPISWNWNFGDPSSSNNTSVLPNPQHEFSGNGTYNVSLQASNECGYNSSNQYITVTNCGNDINEHNLSNIKNILISPNPVSNSAMINFTIVSSGKISIKLCDITGKNIIKVYESDFNPGEYSIQFERPEKLSAGTYFIEFVSEGSSTTRKVVFK